ncbi:alpha/beta hydrolase fold-3 domain-containing protein [Neofusicoccum parvum]|nr:alpha/beta hydrolase fold-3 domain-containing protein [Neofusicoccum parvum]
MYNTYNTKESVAKLAETDPDYAEYMKNVDVATLLSPENMDKAAEGGATSGPDSETAETLDIPMRDGYMSQLLIHRPKNSPKRSPLVVMIYGGGWTIGDNRQLNPISRTVSGLYGATVVNISYRLAPAHKFPTGPHDVWDNLKWIAANHASLGANVDPGAGFIVGGASAGANLAAVVAQRWLDEKASPPLTGLYLSIPVLLDEEIVPDRYRDLWFSRDQNANAVIVNADAMKRLMEAYEPDVRSPDYSPFNSKTPHVGLPPAYIDVCGQDPLRDDGLVYERALRDHGVKTRLRVYPGVPHGHVMFPGLKPGQKAVYETIEGFGWLLGDEKTAEQLEKAVPGAYFGAA